jgi:hypothetical protein
MAHHHGQTEEEKSYDFLYYLVGLGTGLFIGFIIDVSITWVLVGGLLGLLSAAFYLNILVKGREDK